MINYQVRIKMIIQWQQKIIKFLGVPQTDKWTHFHAGNKMSSAIFLFGKHFMGNLILSIYLLGGGGSPLVLMIKIEITHCNTYIYSHSYIYSLIHSFTHSFTHSFIHSFVPSFTHSFIHSFIHLFIHSFIHPFIHLFIHSFIHSFIYSFIHSFLISSILDDYVPAIPSYSTSQCTNLMAFLFI